MDKMGIRNKRRLFSHSWLQVHVLASDLFLNRFGEAQSLGEAIEAQRSLSAQLSSEVRKHACLCVLLAWFVGVFLFWGLHEWFAC